MEREVSLSEISDGRLYGLNDMVKAGCNDCKGCFACCQGMGNSIILDPLDICRLTSNLHISFEELLMDRIELNVIDGIILPNLKMTGSSEHCTFLTVEGRCGIHAFRPGICRLFPLGRYYENYSFQYFLQVHECKKENKTKVKVRKWIDTPDLINNEQFIRDWHNYLKTSQAIVKTASDEQQIKKISMYILKNFFKNPYGNETEFYLQFRERLEYAATMRESLV